MNYRHRLLAPLLLLALLAWPTMPATPVSAAPRADPTTAFAYFPETGHNISPRIKGFFDANGGRDVFGLPLTEIISDDLTLQVQYFERARLELRPEIDGGVQLSPLGR